MVDRMFWQNCLHSQMHLAHHAVKVYMCIWAELCAYCFSCCINVVGTAVGNGSEKHTQRAAETVL